MRDTAHYIEDIEFPLPGTRVRKRSHLVVFAFFSMLAIILLPGALVLIALSGMDIVIKVFYMSIWAIGESVLILETWFWIHPRLKSSLPIAIYEDMMQMPVTLFERIIFLRRPTILRHEIASLRVVESSQWDSEDSLELIVVTRRGRTYRSSAKDPRKIWEIVDVLSKVWSDVHVEPLSRPRVG